MGEDKKGKRYGRVVWLASNVAVSIVALVVFGVHTFGETDVDAVGLGLIGLALLPWLSLVLTTAELPGGLKVEFRQLEDRQEKQAEDIRALQFLLTYFITDHEHAHLKRLAENTPFLVRKDDSASFFQEELRRLRSLRFIRGKPGKGIRSLRDALATFPEGQVDVSDHFEIDGRGEEYLNLRRLFEERK